MAEREVGLALARHSRVAAPHHEKSDGEESSDEFDDETSDDDQLDSSPLPCATPETSRDSRPLRIDAADAPAPPPPALDASAQRDDADNPFLDAASAARARARQSFARAQALAAAALAAGDEALAARLAEEADRELARRLDDEAAGAALAARLEAEEGDAALAARVRQDDARAERGGLGGLDAAGAGARWAEHRARIAEGARRARERHAGEQWPPRPGGAPFAAVEARHAAPPAGRAAPYETFVSADGEVDWDEPHDAGCAGDGCVLS